MTTQTPVEKLVSPTLPPRRPKRSFARRLLYMLRMRLRQMFSRDALVSGVRSLAWVAPMTILIWVYAEREQIATQSVAFRVEAKNSDPNRVIDLSGPGPEGRNFTIRADLSGPQAGLQQVKEKLESGALLIDIPGLASGKFDVSLLLANDPLFVKHGITVTNVSPQRIDVFVDPIDTRKVTIKLPPSVTTFDADFTPSVIDVRGPRSVLDAARDKGNLVAIADLKDSQGVGVTDLPNVQVTVPLTDPHITFSPSTVRAVLTPKNAEVTGFVKSVTVHVAYTQDKKWDKGKAVPQEFMYDVPVIGPADMFSEGEGPGGKKALIYRGVKAIAILDVSSSGTPLPALPDDLVHSANISYDFGDTKVRAAPDAKRDLDFKYVERGKTE